MSCCGDEIGATGATGVAGSPGGATGVAGATGATGVHGASGVTGATGATGASGVGSTGATGAAGSPGGATGATGTAGATGLSGATGTAGLAGASGATGATGARGATGFAGATGLTGDDGATGATGATGVAGATGTVGATGLRGSTGATGVGSTGATGAAGATGVGSTGATGVAGATGTAGASGATGATGLGATGATGVAGSPGGATGLSGATGATGAAGSPGGATGASGVAGASGATGATGAAGSNGTNGATGATGVGATGATGVVGATGTAGNNGATGATGAVGPVGATGLGATGVAGATGATGARGATGFSGASGLAGATGASGVAGAAGTNGATGATGLTGATGAGSTLASTVQLDYVQNVVGVSANAAREDHRHAEFPEPSGTWLVYCVDYDGLVLTGNDATAAPGYSTVSFAAALTAAKLTPFKTFERIQQLLPRNGNNANLTVIGCIRTANATYLKMDGVTAQPFSWVNQLHGFSRVTIRATDPGSGGFTNTTADKILCGFVKVGNTGGYSPTGSLTVRSFTLGLFGGGSAGLPTESGGFSAISGLRIRFDSATATAALQNKCGMIWQNAAGSLILGSDLPVAPSTSDRFYIEKPGLYFGDLSHSMGRNGGAQTSGGDGVSIAGVATSTTGFTTFSPGSGLCIYSGINFDTSANAALPSVEGFDTVLDTSRYLDETAAIIDIGFGIRSLGQKRYLRGLSLSSTNNFCSQHVLFSNLGNLIAGSACFWSQGFRTEALNGTPGGHLEGSTNFLNCTIGRRLVAVTNSRTRITATASAPFGAVNLTGSGGANIQGLDISNQSVAALIVRGTGAHYDFDDIVSSDNGNTGPILDTGKAIGCVFTWGTKQGNTIASTGADIETFTGPMPFSALTSPDGLNFDDNNLNQYFGTGEAVIKGTEDVLNRSGLDLAAFLVIRSTGFIDGATPAQADTLAHAKGILGVSIAISPADDEQRWCNYGLVPGLFEGTTPVLGDTVYLSAALAGYVTVDKPALAFELGTFKRTGTGGKPNLYAWGSPASVVNEGVVFHGSIKNETLGLADTKTLGASTEEFQIDGPEWVARTSFRHARLYVNFTRNIFPGGGVIQFNLVMPDGTDAVAIVSVTTGTLGVVNSGDIDVTIDSGDRFVVSMDSSDDIVADEQFSWTLYLYND